MQNPGTETQAESVVVKAEMLIRKPVADVFEAFINPDITTQFWFTRSSGRLEPGARVQWDWEMYGASAQVTVKAIEPNRRILIEWPGYADNLETVEWLFTPTSDHETFVTITNTGFTGSWPEIARSAADSMGGFTIVLCGLKALLEHGIRLNLVGDKSPYAHVKP